MRKMHPGRRPKSRKAEGDTRASILRSARKVFARRGFDGTSMREVADAARVNNAMIYYHFKDKTELYRSVIADSFDALNAVWEEKDFRSGLPVRKKIERFIEGYIRFHQKNEDLRRIMAMEFAGSSKNVCWICEKYFSRSYQHLVELFREGIRNGELKRFEPTFAVPALMGVVVHNFIMLPFAEQIHGKKVDLSSRTFGAFVSGLFLDGLGSHNKRSSAKTKGKRMS